MKKRLFVIGLLVLALAAAPALAREMGGPQGLSRPGHRNWSPLRTYYLMKHLQDRLQLTDEQLAKIKTLSFALEEKRMDMWTQNAKLGLDLKKLLDTDQPDYAAVEKVMNARSASRSGYWVEWIKTRRELAKVFTPAQTAQLKEMKKAWLLKAWERRGDRQPGQGQGRGPMGG